MPGPRGRGAGEVLARRPGAEAVTLAVPVVVPLGMRVVFGMLARRLGARRGYLAGFVCYWAGCYLLPVALLGRRQVAALLRQPAGLLPRPRWLAALALLVPPLGAAGTQLLPELGQADRAQLATAGVLAAVNATGEELLWRGLFVVGSLTTRSGAGCGRPPGSPPGTWRRHRPRAATGVDRLVHRPLGRPRPRMGSRRRTAGSPWNGWSRTGCWCCGRPGT